jgi:hypothetical protein
MQASLDSEHDVRSGRWRALGLVFCVAGIVVSLVAVAAILQIDHAAQAVHFSTAQGIVGGAATVVGILGILLSGLCCVRLWRRPGLRFSQAGVMVCSWRPVLVPWQVISGVTTSKSRSGSALPALRLCDGQVLALKFVSVVAAGYEDENEAMRLLRACMPVQHPASPQPPAAADSQPSPVPAAAGGSLSRRRLPGIPAYRLPRCRLPRNLISLPLFGGVIVMGFAARAQNPGAFNVAQILAGGGIAAAVLGLIVGFWWSRWTRAVVVGTDWLAWRPRGSLWWHVLYFRQLLSVYPSARAGRGVLLKRSDGRGIWLRRAELQEAAAAHLISALDQCPGFTAAARQALGRAAGQPATA